MPRRRPSYVRIVIAPKAVLLQKSVAAFLFFALLLQGVFAVISGTPALSSHEGQEHHYYLAPWEWIEETDDQGTITEEYWAGPHRDKLLGLVDLRSLPAQGKAGGTPEGYGFFSYTEQVSIPNSLYLGDSLDSILTNQQKAQVRQSLNIQGPLQSDTLRDILWDILTVHADPTGQAGPKPLRGSRGKPVQLHLGGQSVIKQEPFTEEHRQRTIAVFQADYERNRRTYPQEVVQKWVGATMKDLYGEMNDDRAKELVPEQYRDEKPLWRKPETTITDDFNRANESLDAGDWVEIDGDWSVSNNKVIGVNEGGGTGHATAHHTDSLSSDDHYSQIKFVDDVSDFRYLGPGVRLSGTSNANESGYIAYSRAEGGVRNLVKIINGVGTSLANDTGGTAPDGRTLRLEVNGSNLSFFDGDLETAALTATDPDITGTLTTGLVSHPDGGATGDNFEAADLNATPTITSVSDTPDPVEAESTVTFSVDWNDADSGDQVKVHICKTDAISSGSCSGDSWADSAAFTTTDPEEVTYTTDSDDVGDNNYFAFVCDDDTACSASTSGTFTVDPQGGRLSPPAEPSGGFQVFINEDKTTATTSPWVTLTFQRSAEASKMAVSNRSEIDDAPVERFHDTKKWHLCADPYQQDNPPQDCREGSYTVYARFYTEQLVPSDIVSASIKYKKPEPEEPSQQESSTEDQTNGSGTEEAVQKEANPEIAQLKTRIRELRLQLIDLATRLVAALQE